ncbi:S8 family peptidase [Rhodotorula paludigena]|uniref:S8 family peptidase n=1 Tax=Rhodotorula paludigena TaxID=86838 RepID=UPI0031794D0B
MPAPRRLVSWTALSLCALLSLSLAAQPAEAKLQPAKRDYDSHVYYVLELDPAQLAADEDGWSAHDVAQALGAEHVEQVGELAGHYLIRAEAGAVDRGEEAWTPPPAPGEENEGRVQRRAIKELAEGKRDLVLERYDLLRRALPGPASFHLHAKRSLASSASPSSHRRLVRSLERQYPRLRIKRDLPVLPPDETWAQKLRRRALQLDRRQGAAVVQAGANIISAAAERFGIVDPLWGKQWHLINGVMPENSVNVTGVWDQGVVGKGVNVAIVDDGLDMHSDDLAANFHADGSWDYNDNTALPEPRLSDDQHGTRCAGEIAAVKNDVCGVGVAHGAGIAGIRILSASISDADEASSLNYGYQTNDIYSCSWGPPDDGRSMEAPGRLIVKAMLNGVQNGRKGKGSVFVFASGNGGAVDDQCNFDGYTNSLMSITVGAIDRKGLHPFYSEACSANMVVTYSSGSGDNIHTTDVGKRTCTDRHGGTSAAAPIAAGIFALVLEVRPDLTWRDMQHLCVRTAVQINPNDPDWQMTASGRPYNHKYGFGKLDAYAIVEAAKTWQLVKPQAWWLSPVSFANPTNNAAGEPVTADGAVAQIEVTRDDLKRANVEKLEHVTITVNIAHQRRGNLEVELVSPRGMKSILARPRRFDESVEGMPGWVFMSVKHWDEDAVGTWTLRVRDRQNNNRVGTFYSYQLQLWGSAIDAARAVPYTLPPDPSDEDDVAVPPIVAAPTTTAAEDQTEPTKTYVKPTAHLPDDHADAHGEAHSSFADHYNEPTSTPASGAEELADEDSDDETEDETDTSVPPSAPTWVDGSGSLYDQTPGYLSGLSSLVGSTTWLFVAAGVIVIFVAGTTAFLCLRRRQARRAAGGAGRGGYAFAPATDFEDDDDDDLVPMSAMERGRVRLAGGDASGPGSARTRELFNAFAIDSDDEGDATELVERGKSAQQGARRSYDGLSDEEELEAPGPEKGQVRFRDEPDDDLNASTTGLTLAEQERRARAEFSD